MCNRTYKINRLRECDLPYRLTVFVRKLTKASKRCVLRKSYLRSYRLQKPAIYPWRLVLFGVGSVFDVNNKQPYAKRYQ